VCSFRETRSSDLTVDQTYGHNLVNIRMTDRRTNTRIVGIDASDFVVHLIFLSYMLVLFPTFQSAFDIKLIYLYLQLVSAAAASCAKRSGEQKVAIFPQTTANF